MIFIRFAAGLALMLATSVAARALDEIPAYAVTEIGSELIAENPGTTFSIALAVNESGDATGWAVVNGALRSFAYTAESGAVLLPMTPGGNAAQAVDISDRDAAGEVVIVGTTKSSTLEEPGRAALWIYDTATGTVLETREIGALNSFASSAATAVRPDGTTVIGYSTGGGFTGTPAMIYDVALDSLAPLDFPTTPSDINNFGEVTGGRYILETDGTLTDLGSPPELNSPTLNAINGLGWVAGRASATYTDGAGRFVMAAVRHTLDWDRLWVNSAFDTAHDINFHGDVVGDLGISASIRAALFIDALDRVFIVQDLLAPGWRDKFFDRVGGINDSGQIVGSGTGGAILLTSTGPMPAPSAPADLTAVPHLPTWQQPWNAITLNWVDTSELDFGFYVERSLAGAGAWTEIKTNWINTQLWDMNVDLGVTYDYRVRARGLAGYSDYSNIATATAPSDPVDTTDPVAVILSPADGAEVSGNVSISIEVTDNEALSYVELSTTLNSSSVNICAQSVSGSSYTTTCTWRTRKVPAGDYPLYLYASDVMGNGTTTQIMVTLVEQTKGGGGGGGPKCNPKKGC